MPKPSKISIHQPKYLEILDRKRRQRFGQLSFTADLGIYLAGGTALAFYLNHRTSADFDFYSSQSFAKGQLVRIFGEKLKGVEVEILRDIENTFDLEIEGIHLSCFYYPYPLICKLNRLEDVALASLEDLSAMKLVAIAQRDSYRDFIDLYYLLEKFGLSQLLGWTQEKYPSYSEIAILKGLLFFQDAEKNLKEEQKRITVFDLTLTWKKVKNFIREQVASYQKSFIHQ